MAIDRKALELEIALTSGEYFKNNMAIIIGSVDTAIKEYSSIIASESAFFISTANGETTYNLPNDFRTAISVYEDTLTDNTIYTNINFALTGLNVTQVDNYSEFYNNSYFLDILMDKIEFYRLQSSLPKVIKWTIDEEAGTIVFKSVPDPYDTQKNYIIHYYKVFNVSTIPDYHQDHIFKLASSRLLQLQAMAMSKIVQTSGPGLSSTWVSPQVLMTMANDLKTSVVNALSAYVPERG